MFFLNNSKHLSWYMLLKNIYVAKYAFTLDLKKTHFSTSVVIGSGLVCSKIVYLCVMLLWWNAIILHVFLTSALLIIVCSVSERSHITRVWLNCEADLKRLLSVINSCQVIICRHFTDLYRLLLVICCPWWRHMCRHSALSYLLATRLKPQG